MQILRRTLFTALLILGWTPAWAGSFLSSTEDMPLAPGLTELANAGLVFDVPGGRIIEAYARGSLRSSDVLRFYATTLPQLGWVRESDLLYSRESERLRLDLNPQGPTVLVHFTLSPE